MIRYIKAKSIKHFRIQQKCSLRLLRILTSQIIVGYNPAQTLKREQFASSKMSPKFFREHCTVWMLGLYLWIKKKKKFYAKSPQSRLMLNGNA